MEIKTVRYDLESEDSCLFQDQMCHPRKISFLRPSLLKFLIRDWV